MSGTGTYTLVGLVDPSGMSLGFLVPLFASEHSNAPFVQHLDQSGKIAEFEHYGAPDAPLLAAPPIRRTIGEQAVHAFAFGIGDIAIATGDDMEVLAHRLDDPALAKRPLLAMELADFLNLSDRRCQFAVRAHAEMRNVSPETANHWRDLSVLTTELRRELARRPERLARSLAGTVVARVSEAVVEISGAAATAGGSQRQILESAVTAALSTLAPLYPVPARGWKVQLRHRRERVKVQERKAALLIASPRMLHRGSLGPWPSPPDIQVFTHGGIEFTRVVEESRTPLFVAFDSAEPEQMRKSTGDWTVREMHGIGVDAAKRLSLPEDGQHWRATHIPGAGIRGGGSQAERGVAAGVRLAIAAELDRQAADITWLPQNALLLRLRGLSPDPVSDAWAALYDRAWAFGLAPWKSLLIRGSMNLSGDADWLTNVLFQKARFLSGDLVNQVMEETRATAALLVDATRRSEDDVPQHRGSVMTLLERQGWQIGDSGFSSMGSEHSILGARARIALGFADAAMVSTGASLGQDPREVNLRELDRVVVTCVASAGAVFDRLTRKGELAVNVRDLVGFHARDATPLSLIGLQLRRYLTGLRSPSRTRMLAMLSMQAFRWGRVDAHGASEVLRVVESPSLGDAVHLVISSVRAENNQSSAEVRVLERLNHAETESPWTEITTYRLTVEPDSISVLDP
ncbi:hypothetical protein [Salinarimonas sp.]|uniref:hypothetical protein n=1 Tax=Salinarimonas sp. TaxID=2766526 RepID=UPI0032D999A1